MTAASRATPSAPASDPAFRAGTAILVVVSLSHLANDAYLEMLTPLLPRLRETYDVSIAQVAVLVAILSVVGSVLQPLLGMLGDHVDRRWLAAVGPALTGVGMSMMGYAPTYGALALLI